MLKAMMREAVAVVTVMLMLVSLVLVAWLATGCDENDPNFPGVSVTASATPGGQVHGTISVSPSPLPPFEVRFKDVSPTPVEF